MNTLNNIYIQDPWMGLYFAIDYLKQLNYNIDFPVERKILFNGYKEYCGTSPNIKPLTQNVFTIVTNTVLLSDGYIVSTVKHPGNKYVAVLVALEGLPRPGFLASKKNETLTK